MHMKKIGLLILAASCILTSCGKKDAGCKLDSECPDGQICRNMKCEADPSAKQNGDESPKQEGADSAKQNAKPTGPQEFGMNSFEENKVLKLEDLGFDIDYILSEEIRLDDNTKLEIGPGVTIDMQSSGSGFSVFGDAALMVKGTADKPVVFKSTNSSTWKGLWFDSKNKDNALNYLQIQNADGEDQVIEVGGEARLAIDHVTLDGSSNNGIHLAGDAKFTKFTNNTIKNCKGFPLVLDSYAQMALIGDGNTYENNRQFIRMNAYRFDDVKETVIKKQPIPYLLTEGIYVDGESGTLTIEPGTEFVFEHEREAVITGSVQLKLGGSAENPVIMRGLNDESNYWRGLFIDSERPCTIDGLTLSQTGNDEYTSLRIRDNANITLANIQFNATEHRCLEIGGEAKVTVKSGLNFVKCEKGNIFDHRIEGDEDKQIISELPVTE